MDNQPSQSGVDESALDEQQQQQQKQDETNQQQASPAIMVPIPAVPLPHPEFMIPHAQLELGQTLVRAAYHYPDPYYGGIVAAYGPQTVVHPHMLGVPHTGLPLPSDAIEEPVYVNAKQYHGILRRRQSRAKAESENKLIKSRKPYLHESRHLHAIKRARGCGGRFLNSKSNNQDGMSQENNSNGNIGQEPGLDKSDSGKKAKLSTQY
ncbi:hypothetical protein SUGI_1131560 [Cryptomeria japonica]|uniref:nuclear transcription factor Y subunit A-7 isoform X2 n=1 Tax=Cryptomeria japonica TaxID=3369 RepID=UPI002414AD9A|nr:nuclear transcription factor Y subunit A-7 isoform X2 [Cryptomeria japonica]GLJ53104.1 hypothetical protein SUGI_1131560 [Cryptomeria japonica]